MAQGPTWSPGQVSVTQEQALHALAEGVKPCPQYEPDNALGFLDYALRGRRPDVFLAAAFFVVFLAGCFFAAFSFGSSCTSASSPREALALCTDLVSAAIRSTICPGSASGS
ncbi:DUF6233 domain-containing protein [Streptomyces coeruleorubidus]|uniref:DUF6233 domain-containing protein n=1 Tax=Streptomyces coeruleorubidus TaxID=116188 RepID=A0ABZ0KP43_STRC4|nr:MULTISPECIES: DUF6233 domain-containing protein [Streptomyces]WOT39590.1 DUF6233 domain-containing protein [Streptomyces coeruleorubidus]